MNILGYIARGHGDIGWWFVMGITLLLLAMFWFAMWLESKWK
jgi:hypothetical protein